MASVACHPLPRASASVVGYICLSLRPCVPLWRSLWPKCKYCAALRALLDNGGTGVSDCVIVTDCEDLFDWQTGFLMEGFPTDLMALAVCCQHAMMFVFVCLINACVCVFVCLSVWSMLVFVCLIDACVCVFVCLCVWSMLRMLWGYDGKNECSWGRLGSNLLCVLKTTH